MISWLQQQQQKQRKDGHKQSWLGVGSVPVWLCVCILCTSFVG